MTDVEVVAHLRSWQSQGSFSWPTDACGYEQHIRFVDWRNEQHRLGERADHLKYADLLEAGKIAPYKPFDLPDGEPAAISPDEDGGGR